MTQPTDEQKLRDALSECEERVTHYKTTLEEWEERRRSIAKKLSDLGQPELPKWEGEIQPTCVKTNAFEAVCGCQDCFARRLGIRIYEPR